MSIFHHSVLTPSCSRKNPLATLRDLRNTPGYLMWGKAPYHVLKVISEIPKVTFWHSKWLPRCTNWHLGSPFWPNSCLKRVKGTLQDFMDTSRKWMNTLGDLRGSPCNLMGALGYLIGRATHPKEAAAVFFSLSDLPSNWPEMTSKCPKVTSRWLYKPHRGFK